MNRNRSEPELLEPVCTVLYRQDPDAGQTGPGCQNPAFHRFEPIIIRDFHRDFEKKKTLEKHISKQMRVYKQITFFNKKSKFPKIFFPDRKMDLLKGEPIFGLKTGNRNRDEPKPDGKGVETIK